MVSTLTVAWRFLVGASLRLCDWRSVFRAFAIVSLIAGVIGAALGASQDYAMTQVAAVMTLLVGWIVSGRVRRQT